MGRLEGQIAVVTGGSRGIGEAIARRLAEEGATVVITARNPEALDVVAASINTSHPGKAVAMAGHVGKLDQIGPLFDRIVAEVGVPTILVNNAGTNPYFGPLLGTSWGAFDKTFEVNLKGPLEMIRQFIARLDGRTASIINISSILGQQASVMQGAYGMTKAALISLTKTLAVELAQSKIPVRVNAVAPGIVDTRLAAAIVNDPTLSQMVNTRTPMGRVAQPSELGGVVAFLASDDSSFMTGQTIFVDGGYTIG